MSDSVSTASTEKQVLADRYELNELIRQGGTAEVHRAHDQLLDRTVAVKIFRRRDDDPTAQQRFDDEACALARMAHPGLVAIFDVGTVADRPFLVMEFVEGTNLRSRLLAGPLSLPQVLRIGGSLADALAHAHQHGVVHQDVNPTNIMLDQEDMPHLTDFGDAQLAPEQLSDNGSPADVYALGLVLLECLSGEAAPPDLTDLLTAMTATEPRQRPTAETCALRLRAALDDTGSDVEPPRPAPMFLVTDEPVAWAGDEDSTALVPLGPASSPRRRYRSGPVVASVAGIAAAVAALVFLLDTPPTLAGRPPTAVTGSAHSGSGGGGSSDQEAAAGGGTGSNGSGAPGVGRHGAGRHGSAPVAKMLVAKEHPAPANAPAAPPTLASSAPGPVRKAPATTSPAAPPPPPPTVSAAPPTTASAEPTTTVSTPTEPPNTGAPPGNGLGGKP
ncbi:MAG TPA: serine/threonine-protein kinase [Pseudonocardiaceae bacterium]|nr:serine/threonine-protein kinase [Pseudonocardiaceae bacterium]